MEPALALTAAFAVMLSAMGFSVSLRRIEVKSSFGDAGDEVLRRRIRAHGNFIEYAPMAVLAVWALSAANVTPWLVWIIAAIFLATRLLHAAGMLWSRAPTPRAIAMVVQHTTFLAAAALIALALI